MRRFLDRSFPDRSLEADAAELMRAAAPTPDAPEVKQRVRERLLQARVRTRPRFVPAPAAALAVLVIGTAAGATLGVRWWSARHEMLPPAPAATPLAPVTAPRVAKAAVSAPPVVTEAPTAVAPAPTPGRAATQVKPTPPPGKDAETGLLFEATRALRRDGDPARAAALLDDYFRRYPHGTLGEEALATSIEAAMARNDARAPALARRYLARYPNGHFRKAAERALRGSSK
jgi:hypothetical protein